MTRKLAAFAACSLAIGVFAAEPVRSDGSTAFCLFELPREGDAQRLINLGIVQYLDVTDDSLRIYFGGGNLGSGHESRITVKNRAEAREWIARMHARARECARLAPAGSGST